MIKQEIPFGAKFLIGEIFLTGWECKFRQSGLDEAVVFLPGDIAAFRFVARKYFVSREVDSSRSFLGFLINGEVNMYYLRDDSGDRYFLDKEETPA